MSIVSDKPFTPRDNCYAEVNRSKNPSKLNGKGKDFNGYVDHSFESENEGNRSPSLHR